MALAKSMLIWDREVNISLYKDSNPLIISRLGFVFVEANVKKWGLAPVQGTLAPPPAYGYEAGSLLLERGRGGETSHLLNTRCQSYSAITDNDDDDNTPLIQHLNTNNNNNSNNNNNDNTVSIPIPSTNNSTTFEPNHNPPSYSTYPRQSNFVNHYHDNITTLI